MKRVNYIYRKRLVLVHLKRNYKNVYIIALSCFLTCRLFCLKKYSETFIQSLITVFLSCQPLAAPQNISSIRTGNPIHDPHGMINFSSRGVTDFGI